MKKSKNDKLGLESAAPWPVIECLISMHWPDIKRLTDIGVFCISPEKVYFKLSAMEQSFN